MLPGNALNIEPGRTENRMLRRDLRIREISCRLLVENYAPAAVVIDHEHEILYEFGPVGQYLSRLGSEPTHNLLAQTSPDLRATLRSAIQGAVHAKKPESIPGGITAGGDAVQPYRIDVLPLPEEEKLQLICFVQEPAMQGNALLEQELHAVRAELHHAIRDLEISNDEHRAINEDAVTANAKYQATIAELMAWKTGLESLAAEMTALNKRLQETLDAQLHTSNTLGNILDNIGAAILLLDRDLKIRFFTPAIHPFFHLIGSDIGRPLGDLKYLAPDGRLAEDCRLVLQTPQPLDREIELASEQWFLRRIVPYCTDNGEVDGLVISFSDITQTRAMLLAQAEAETAQIRHLISVGDALRLPLQKFSQLQGALNTNLSGQAGQELIRLIGETASALSLTLNGLVAGRQIDRISPPETGIAPSGGMPAQRAAAASKISRLTPRERQIMKMVVAGAPSKIIATDLGISQRTVENHRAAIMRKTGSKSLPALTRIAFASGLSDISEAPSDL